MNRIDSFDDPGLGPAEQDVARWLVAERPVPTAALERRGRAVVQRAIHDRVLRRRAGVLLSSGGLALLLSLAIALLG
ncbi:hypothetical protein PAI11_09350 [Patulibacter medicamentivorans]|jgi:hypothetical protein|uniref:Uncharacterized protein n=1 Tax=Patulibacter medicamentivorans TaxID=1097667 RepID=H0E2C2_9ACTN|nr:hypothetical protein [Patulibacter medicamentivorans]EHN12193.1 hypothetical protein PAI11_09350 [Patulibacter medicamentivorans]